jgi:DNA mismatch repair ATPase MutS
MPGKLPFCPVLFIKPRIALRLDAVENLMNNPTFEGEYMEVAKGLPDLERIVSRIHAKNCKVKDFLKVLKVTISMAMFCFFHLTIFNSPLGC